MSEPIPTGSNSEQYEFNDAITNAFISEVQILAEQPDMILYEYDNPLNGLTYIQGLPEIPAKADHGFMKTTSPDVISDYRKYAEEHFSMAGDLVRHLYAGAFRLPTEMSIRYGTAVKSASWQESEYVAEDGEVISVSKTTLETSELFDRADWYVVNRYEQTTRKQSTSFLFIDKNFVCMYQHYLEPDPDGQGDIIDYTALAAWTARLQEIAETDPY